MKETRSVTEIAFELLMKKSKPMHYKEITKHVLNERSMSGKTPHETVRSLIGTDRRFKRVAEGTYALLEWDDYPVARFAKDIAFDVLKQHGQPMNLTDLGISILAQRNFVGGPNQIVRNIVRQDKRFTYDPVSNLVGLVEWAF